MKKAQQTRDEPLFRQHVNALKRQGKADSTIDLYARAVRRRFVKVKTVQQQDTQAAHRIREELVTWSSISLQPS